MEITYRAALQEAAAVLTRVGVPEADLDAWYLLSHVTGMSRAQYFMEQREMMPLRQLEAYGEVIRQRGERIPLQHLLGEAWFMGLPFTVDGNVLIPRQDTEKLVELVLEWEKGQTPECCVSDDPADRCRMAKLVCSDLQFNESGKSFDSGLHPEQSTAEQRSLDNCAGQGRLAAQPPSLLDMCTGSGCIAISLERLGHWSAVAAADISEAALAVAARNVERNGSAVRLVRSDLFASFPGERFDVIVSNPPYIPTAECDTLMPEVRDHDPRLALDGHEDGLFFYRRLAQECPEHLKPGGRVFFEIGWDQGEAVRGLLEQAGFRAVRVIPDDAGRDRVVTGEYYV